MNVKKPSLISDWKKQLKSYSALALFGNILIAIAFGISLGFGIISSQVGMPVAIGVFLFVSLLGAVGRFIRQGKDEDE